MKSSPALVGQDYLAPLVGGGTSRYVNLDFAASAPSLVAVRDAVEEFLPGYSSVHRGAGYKSQLSTRVYEAAREEVGRFVGARADDVVIFTRNTTDSINLLACALADDCQVIAFDTDHHANMLPWRRGQVRYLQTPSTAEETVSALRGALGQVRPGDECLVTFAGASNVTGEVWPVVELAAVAREFGARTLVDVAQLAPHALVDLAGWDVDWVALSGHKLYAPYGAGALVGRRDWLERGAPMLRGGGAVEFVTTTDVLWAGLPERQEAGSPNVVGALAMAVACKTLAAVGMELIADEEAALLHHAEAALASIPGLRRFHIWPLEHRRIGVLPFAVDGFPYRLLATVLSAEHGIAVRDGCFCAHPLMLRLLGVSDAEAARIHDEIVGGSHASVPGALRLSTGLGTTTADIDALALALSQIVADGPMWTYSHDERSGHWTPSPDDRPYPMPGGLTPPVRIEGMC